MPRKAKLSRVGLYNLWKTVSFFFCRQTRLHLPAEFTSFLLVKLFLAIHTGRSRVYTRPKKSAFFERERVSARLEKLAKIAVLWPDLSCGARVPSPFAFSVPFFVFLLFCFAPIFLNWRITSKLVALTASATFTQLLQQRPWCCAPLCIINNAAYAAPRGPALGEGAGWLGAGFNLLQTA